MVERYRKNNEKKQYISPSIRSTKTNKIRADSRCRKTYPTKQKRKERNKTATAKTNKNTEHDIHEQTHNKANHAVRLGSSLRKKLPPGFCPVGQCLAGNPAAFSHHSLRQLRLACIPGCGTSSQNLSLSHPTLVAIFLFFVN